MDTLKNTDHERLALEDRLALVGELEHSRRHLLRAAHVAEEEDKFFYLVEAAEAQRLRRRVMRKLGEIADRDWCPLKSAACIKQLNYETMEGDLELFEELETFADAVSGHALNTDLSDCGACIRDRDHESTE